MEEIYHDDTQNNSSYTYTCDLVSEFQKESENKLNVILKDIENELFKENQEKPEIIGFDRLDERKEDRVEEGKGFQDNSTDEGVSLFRKRVDSGVNFKKKYVEFCNEWKTTFPHLRVEGKQITTTPRKKYKTQKKEKKEIESDEKRFDNLEESPQGGKIQETITENGNFFEIFAFDFDPNCEHLKEEARDNKDLPPISPRESVKEEMIYLMENEIWRNACSLVDNLVDHIEVSKYNNQLKIDNETIEITKQNINKKNKKKNVINVFNSRLEEKVKLGKKNIKKIRKKYRRLKTSYRPQTGIPQVNRPPTRIGIMQMGKDGFEFSVRGTKKKRNKRNKSKRRKLPVEQIQL